LRDGLKEHVEHDGLVVKHDGVKFVWQGKDDMEVGRGQDLCFSFCKPSFPGHVLTLGAVAVATRIVLDALNAAVGASLQMATKISCAAIEQIRYDLALFGPQGI
jgi:hypothetical protein